MKITAQTSNTEPVLNMDRNMTDEQKKVLDANATGIIGDQIENPVKQNPRYRGLRPAVKGQCINPGGRPKTADFRAEIKAFLAQKVKGKPRLMHLLHRLAKYKPEILLHYAYGKPVESVEISGKDGQPLYPPEIVDAGRAIAAARYDGN